MLDEIRRRLLASWRTQGLHHRYPLPWGWDLILTRILLATCCVDLLAGCWRVVGGLLAPQIFPHSFPYFVFLFVLYFWNAPEQELPSILACVFLYLLLILKTRFASEISNNCAKRYSP